MKRRTVRQRRGFTLVEFLVAAAIAALVTMVIFAVYRTASTTFESVETDRRVFDRAVDAVETVARDLTCSARIPLSGTIYFLLGKGTQADDLNSDLCFHTATRVETQDDTEQFQIERVRYYLQPVPQGSESVLALIRSKQVLGVDGTLGEPVLEDIAREVQTFQVVLFDGQNWYGTWPASEGKQQIPSAARITVSCRCGRTVKTFESTAVIRSGMPL